MIDKTRGYGVGYSLLNASSYDPREADLMLKLLDLHYGDGAIAIDCGANIGVHSVEWAKYMTGWGLADIGKRSINSSSLE